MLPNPCGCKEVWPCYQFVATAAENEDCLQRKKSLMTLLYQKGRAKERNNDTIQLHDVIMIIFHVHDHAIHNGCNLVMSGFNLHYPVIACEAL